MTITQDIIRYKTMVSHKHMVVIYHQNTPLPKVRKGLVGYNQIHNKVKSILISSMYQISEPTNLHCGRIIIPQPISFFIGCSRTRWATRLAWVAGGVVLVTSTLDGSITSATATQQRPNALATLSP
jgi:hypothetical protein